MSQPLSDDACVQLGAYLFFAHAEFCRNYIFNSGLCGLECVGGGFPSFLFLFFGPDSSERLGAD